MGFAQDAGYIFEDEERWFKGAYKAKEVSDQKVPGVVNLTPPNFAESLAGRAPHDRRYLARRACRLLEGQPGIKVANILEEQWRLRKILSVPRREVVIDVN